MSKYDIIIVGSGPSGISTALHLVKDSPELAERIVVLEKAVHPRPKLCAGGILPDVDKILERLGLDVSEVPSVSVKEAYFRFKGRGICMKHNPESFKVVRREDFDAWLVNKARERGITVKEEVCVLDILPSDDSVTIKTDKGDFTSSIVVGADGANSIVRKIVINDLGSYRAMAMEILIPSERLEAIKLAKINSAIFDFSDMPMGLQGYVWDFPAEYNGVAAHCRGIYNSRLYDGKVPLNLKYRLKKALLAEGINLDNFEVKAHPIRWFHPKGIFSVPRVLLVGDAAGVDPVFGEGISFSLGYGEIAAQEIKEAFAKNDFSFIGYKDRILSHPMGRCLKQRWFIAKFIYRFRSPTMLRLLWWHISSFLSWYIEHYLIDWAGK